MSSTSSRSGSHTPQNHPNPSLPSQSAASYFSYPVSHVVSGLYRRLTDQNSSSSPSASPNNAHDNNVSTTPGVFTPRRTASPFQPPPLTPLTLTISDSNHEGGSQSTSLQQQHLTRALAEEIRLLVPARLQLVDTWRLAYSLDRDGASLGTLFANCRDFAQRSPRAGFVLVVRDASPNGGAVFGAYMTDPPHPDSHYYGTGECFLWRASVLPPPNKLGLGLGQTGTVAGTAGAAGAGGAGGSEDLPPEMLELAGLPPPPSADTTNAGRSTTLRGVSKHSHSSSHTTSSSTATNNLIDLNDNTNTPTHLAPLPPQPPRSQTQTPTNTNTNTSGTSTPERIRFKAFPYSGVNDYMMFCETGFLSLGGG